MKKNGIKIILGALCTGILLSGTAVSAFASKVVISEDGIRIRSEASTSGSQVATGAKGEKYEIAETVSGSDGYTWYKITLNNNSTGYVRGDLVKVEEDNGTTTTISTDTTENTASSLVPTNANPIQEMTGTVAGNAAVNIRSGAGTGYAKIDALEAGTQIRLVAEASDDSGNKWYQLVCDSKGIEGFIRSDFVENLQETAPVEEPQEEPVAEEPEEPEYVEPEHNDYEIVYTSDDEGVETYYLYDHLTNTRQKVTDLLEAVNRLNNDYHEATASLSTYKIVAIALGAAALILLIVLVIFIIRGRSSEYEYYEDDFEDDDYDDDDVKIAPVTKSKAASEIREKPKTKNTEQNIKIIKDEGPVNPTPRRPRKVQNFLTDDDEFEFEFLNMDDKD